MYRSGQHSPTITSPPFRSHNFRIIFSISTINFPYMICLLYLRANTIWYLYFHLLCDKLFMSFIAMNLLFYSWMWLLDLFHCIIGGSFHFYKFFYLSPVELGVLSCLFGAQKRGTTYIKPISRSYIKF